jgi:hypothetical protein
VEELCRQCDAVAARPSHRHRAIGQSIRRIGQWFRSPDVASDAQLALYPATSRMVDAERERAQELAEANTRLQLLDQIKSIPDLHLFELRTPLALMGAFDLYEADGDPLERARITDIIRTGYERLNGFVGRGLEYFDWLAVSAPVDELTDLRASSRIS